MKSNSLLKKAHLFRCARITRSNVLPEYACAREFIARLASGTFLIRLQDNVCRRNSKKDDLRRMRCCHVKRLRCGRPDGWRNCIHGESRNIFRDLLLSQNAASFLRRPNESLQ